MADGTTAADWCHDIEELSARRRRYVTLNATDTQMSAVDVFRREHRTTLPVIDTTGVLIGIVTIDDALDVAAAR